jgi:hypothetical protein
MNLQWASVTPKRCRRHVWIQTLDGARLGFPRSCDLCGQWEDAVVTRRGRNNRSRGNAIEREIAHKLGLKRVSGGLVGSPTEPPGGERGQLRWRRRAAHGSAS